MYQLETKLMDPPSCMILRGLGIAVTGTIWLPVDIIAAYDLEISGII